MTPDKPEKPKQNAKKGKGVRPNTKGKFTGAPNTGDTGAKPSGTPNQGDTKGKFTGSTPDEEE